MGTSALSNPRSALGRPRRRRRAQGAHRGARRAPLATPHDRRDHPLLFQEHRALVVRRPRRRRSALRARAQDPRPRRDPSESRRGARAGHRPAASRPSALDLPVALRQPRRAGPRAKPRPGTELSDRMPFHEGPRPLARPKTSPSRDHGRRAVRGTRAALVRSHARTRPLAPGLSPRLAPRPDRRGAMAKAAAARRSRRPLATLLPPAVVLRRDRRGPHPRPVAGLSKAPFTSLPSDRQRRRHARRRDRRRPRATRRRPPHDATVFARAKR
jgi:hypothetical protein